MRLEPVIFENLGTYTPKGFSLHRTNRMNVFVVGRQGGRSDSFLFSLLNRMNRRKRKRQLFVGEPMKENSASLKINVRQNRFLTC